VTVSLTADDVIAALQLAPHPEGGYYRETYRGQERVTTPRGERASATAILFLVTGQRPSRLHRLASDELWFFHGGDPLELALLFPDGRSERLVLGRPADARERGGGAPQALVPAGVWQGARLVPRTAGLPSSLGWSLTSCVVAPGFEFGDLELARRGELEVAYPHETALIRALTAAPD
jgi:hypothetical protein